MNILFVVPYVPNLVRTRPYNLIRHLSKRGNQVTVLTLWTSEQEREQLDQLRQLCHEVIALPMPLWRSLLNSVWALPSRRPLQSVFSWRPELVSSLNGRSPYDVIHIEHLRGSRYGLYLKQQTSLPVVWDSVDCITHLFRQASVESKNMIGRIRSRFELDRTEYYEAWLLDKFEHVIVTSPADRAAMLQLGQNHSLAKPISVLGNGVDIEHFRPDTAVTRDQDTLVISGKMSYHANTTMVLHLFRQIMPLVWAKRPEVKLYVVGTDPGREIQALAEHPNVIVTGTVEALPPYLQRAAISVAPIQYGAGIQNKVLEALACATPVITTSQAMSALQAVPGRDLMVADDPEAYAAAIVELLADPEKRSVLGRNGRTYVETHHHWPNVAAGLENIYRQAIASSQNHSRLHRVNS
ncbi:MAG: glycosyltransferase [Anaerolineaceae bacterium]|nr:glycosyltransferase [Anaerolineaceae bacterium]